MRHPLLGRGMDAGTRTLVAGHVGRVRGQDTSGSSAHREVGAGKTGGFYAEGRATSIGGKIAGRSSSLKRCSPADGIGRGARYGSRGAWPALYPVVDPCLRQRHGVPSPPPCENRTRASGIRRRRTRACDLVDEDTAVDDRLHQPPSGPGPAQPSVCRHPGQSWAASRPRSWPRRCRQPPVAGRPPRTSRLVTGVLTRNQHIGC